MQFVLDESACSVGVIEDNRSWGRAHMGLENMLIVDDLEVNRRVLKECFADDFAIIEASDGFEAIRIIEQRGSAIAIVLLDIVMPDMDGIEVLKWLRQSQHRLIPVVAITAEASYQLEALENGAEDFIAKPADSRVMRARIRNVLSHSALESEKQRSAMLFDNTLRMNHLVNCIPGGIATYRLVDGRFETQYFSDGVPGLSGHSREEYEQLTSHDAAIIIYEEDRRRLLDAATAALVAGQPVDESYRVYHKNGSLAWVHLSASPTKTEDGSILVYAVFQRPERLAQLYDNLVNESQDIIYVSDVHNYDLLYMNRTGLRAIGKEASDYSSKKCYEFLFEKSSPCTFCKLQNMEAEQFCSRDFTYPLNGRTYRMRGKLTDWNGLAAHVEYMQDVTESRRIQQRNEDLSRQFELVMENIPGGMCVYRIDGEGGVRPLVYNQAFCDAFGYRPDCREVRLGESSFLDVYPEDLSDLLARLDESVQKNSAINCSYRIRLDASARCRWVNLNGVVVSQADGSKLFYANYADITEEREVQAELTRVQRSLEDLRQKAQDALENYQSLVDTVPGGIVQYEVREGKMLTRYFSNGMCQLTGYPRDERGQMSEQDVLSLAHEEDAPILLAAVEDAVARRRDLDITYRIVMKNGDPRWVHLNASYSAGPQGESLYQAVFTDVDKMKRIERELQENQLRYEVAIKSSGINIWEYDIQCDSLYVVSNSSRIKQNCFRIEHYVRSTLENDYVREDSIDRFLSIFTRLRQGVSEVTEDIWYKTTDEAGWWCERVTYTTAFDRAGKPAKAFGAGRDVTREKAAEKRFREELSYRRAIQSDNLASVLLDLSDNEVLEVDSSFRTVLDLAGCTADRYFEKTSEAIVGEKAKADFAGIFDRRKLLGRFASGDFMISLELTRLYDDHKTDKIYWINYSAHLIQDPLTRNVIAHISSIDITQEKVMQTIMETVSKADYDFFVVVDGYCDSARDYGVDPARRLFDESESFERQNEAWIRDCVCSEDVERVVEGCRIDTVWPRIEGGGTYKFSFSMHMPDGEVRRKRLQMIAISVERKTYLMSRVDVNDVYEEQEASKGKLRQALLEAEKANRAKTDFLSRISHDIRTPISAVISLAALGMESQRADEMQAYLRKIGISGEYLLAIINDVLDLRKMENKGLVLHPEAVYLPTFVRETLSIVAPNAEAKHVDLQFKEVGVGDDCLRFDPTYVRQVIVNLLSNAIKFTPERGRVELFSESSLCEDGRVRNRITVRDTGVGISPEFLPRVFSPFEQEETRNDSFRQGTGLGLAIVQAIVKQMGGTVRVESEQGRGSTFLVDWVFEAASKDDVRSDSADDAETDFRVLAGRRVLLAEDQPLNVEIAEKLLEKKQILVDSATNGQLAVDRFCAADPAYYDAILMDIRMPVLNGLDAARTIRALERPDAATIPIVAMTANAFDEDVRSALSAGMNAHLAKPVDPQELYRTLARLMALSDS